MNDTIGMIGLGNAGSALARALSGKRPLVGYDVDPARRDGVAELKLAWASSVEAVGASADTVLLSLPKAEISRSVVAALAGAAQSPRVIIETSTVTPKVAQQLDAICHDAGIAFVDAAIAGGVQSMAAGKVTFLVGGDAPAFERAKPVLELLAETIHHLGPVGAGRRYHVERDAAGVRVRSHPTA